MNTVIFEHVDNSTTELLKQLAERMGLHCRSKKEKKLKKEAGVITNPELLKTIEDYEKGKLNLIKVDFANLKKDLAEKIKLNNNSKKEKKESGVVTNPELLTRIKRIENGTAELIDVKLNDLKKTLNA